MNDFIWSGSDFPYMCLIDKFRTLKFKKAIEATVKPGDIVADIGSGSGILAFFAAAAGTGKVYAVEADHLMAESLRTSIKLNNLQHFIEVVEGNALKVDLPKDLDVVIAELLETGLLDEMQVKVFNHLRTKGIISKKTKVIPAAYETFIRLLNVDNEFYGFKIAAPVHDWPFYSQDSKQWHPLKKNYLTKPQSLGLCDFQSGLVQPEFNKVLEFSIDKGQTANAIEISGMSWLDAETKLGAANSYNGNKILYLNPVVGPSMFKLKISYSMSEGLGSFKASTAK